MIEKATYDKPHTFEEAKQFLAQGNYIDYEVLIPREGYPHGLHGALMTSESWLEDVANGSLIDYDGMGNELDENGNILGTVPAEWEGEPRKSRLLKVGDPGHISPSQAARIRPETRYILWYNR